MASPAQVREGRQAKAPKTPSHCDEGELMAHLAEVQARMRRIVRDFGISSASIGEMARQAERAIPDTAVRDEFLRLLVDLHEFGREAKQRGLLDRTTSGDGSDGLRLANLDRTAHRAAPADDDADAISEDVSREFFARLDS